MPLAFAFTDFWMLGWLAAAAAPVLIHLWNQRKHREVEWAAMEFLLAAIRKNSRRIRIEHWLLLAIRTAIVVLAVLAVAGPYLQNFASGFASGQPTHRVLVIDGSYSMDYKLGELARFDRAKQLATQLVEQSSVSDGFSLVLMGRPSRVILDSPIARPKAVVEEIENLQLQHTAADLPATLAQVNEIVSRAASEHPELSQTQVFWFTDLGQNTWNGAANADAAKLAESASLIAIDVGEEQTENLAVNSLRCAEPYATINRPLNFAAQISDYGRQPRRTTVQWWVDGQRVKSEAVELAAGGQQTASLEWRFDQPGNHTIEARTPADALEIDNHRWRTIDVRPEINVLVVNGDGQQQAVRQLVSALNPERDPQQSPIRVEVASESALGDRDLTRYDLVCLSNVGQFTPSEGQILSRYVHGGGGLVIFLGDRVQPERYNQVLGGGQEGSVRLLPAQLDRPAATAKYSIDPLAYRHPIVAEFAGNERAGLLTTPIAKYFRLKPSAAEDAHANTALAIRESGDPLIVEEAMGEGRVVLVALPASLTTVDPMTKEPWTMMPAWHSFLPLVQETLAFVLGSQRQQDNLEVGEAISGIASASDQRIAITHSSPTGVTETFHATAGAEGRWQFDDTWQSGIYRAQPSGPDSTAAFAVNVDTGDTQTGESSLRKIGPHELPSEFTVLKSVQTSAEKQRVELNASTGLQNWFLYAVLILLLTETGYAAWLGRRSGG